MYIRNEAAMMMSTETRRRLRMKLAIGGEPLLTGRAERVGRRGWARLSASRTGGRIASTDYMIRGADSEADAPPQESARGSPGHSRCRRCYFEEDLTDHSQKFQNGPVWLPMYFTPSTRAL